MSSDDQQQAKQGFFKRLRARINRGDSWLTYDLANLAPGGKIDEDSLEELESLLVMADVGIPTTEKIIAGLNKRLQRKELKDLDALRNGLQAALVEILEPVAKPLAIDPSHRPFVILMVGVNGAGKTTTVGKLAQQFKNQGLKVMLAAGDTFRAAAVEQLQTWGERLDVPVIRQGQGADSASVIYDALQSAQARGIDVLIADTAGRLHTQTSLMDELEKIKRVMSKLDPEAPQETLLVLDAGTGQNALAQASNFRDTIGIDRKSVV